MIDVTQKKVIVKGRVDPKKRMHRIRLQDKHKNRKAVEFGRVAGEGYSSCSSNYLEQNERNVNSTDNLIHETCCFCCASS